MPPLLRRNTSIVASMHFIQSHNTCISRQGRIQDFGKGGGGGPANCEVLKRVAFTCTRATFSPLFEVLGSPKRGGPPPPWIRPCRKVHVLYTTSLSPVPTHLSDYTQKVQDYYIRSLLIIYIYIYIYIYINI